MFNFIRNCWTISWSCCTVCIPIINETGLSICPSQLDCRLEDCRPSFQSETQVSGSKGCRGDLIHKFCLSTLTCPSYLNDWHRVLIFVLANLEFLPNWKMVWKWWALFRNTVKQTNNPQSPWAKRWQLRHMLKDWEKRLKSFFGKFGDSKMPLILGNLESHKNAQAGCILSKDLRRPKVFNSGWFPGSEVASEG